MRQANYDYDEKFSDATSDIQSMSTERSMLKFGSSFWFDLNRGIVRDKCLCEDDSQRNTRVTGSTLELDLVMPFNSINTM